MDKFNNICRTCMKKGDDNEDALISVFNSEICSLKSLQFSEMLLECASVQVTLDDKLPKIICRKCADCLKNYYEFKIACHQTEKELLKLLDQSVCELDNENSIKSESLWVEPEVSIKDELEANDILFSEDGHIESDVDYDDGYSFGNELETSNDVKSEEPDSALTDDAGRPCRCKECNKLFPERSKLELHMKCHKVSRKPKCKICNKVFNKKAILDRHMKRMHLNCEVSFKENERNPEEKIKYQCKVCKKSFQRKSKLDIHLQTCLKKFKCKICEKYFIDKENLINHISKMHKGSRIGETEFITKHNSEIRVKTESESNETTNSETVLESNLSKGNDKKKITRNIYVCNICQRSFKKLFNIQRHIAYHFKKIKCEKCNQEFSKIDYGTHRQMCTNTKSNNSFGDYYCSRCDKYFGLKYNYDRHILSHPENRSFECEVCHKLYGDEVDLRRHRKTHGELTGFHCDTCPKTFGDLEELNKHTEEHQNPLPHLCSECGKRFLQYKNLAAHLRTHTGEKPFLCPTCGRAFALSGNLKTHIRIHNGEKPYTCNVCNKSFAQWASLRSHKVVHSNERRYVCQTCGASFKRSHTLNKHQQHQHMGVRNYACSICEKRFTTKSSCDKHYVIHTGEKNFVCSTCGRAFNRKSHLVTHTKIHTGERPHVCTVCGRGFIQRHCLVTHMNTHNQ